jgi:hypothetical protein
MSMQAAVKAWRSETMADIQARCLEDARRHLCAVCEQYLASECSAATLADAVDEVCQLEQAMGEA